MGPQNKI